MPPVSLDEIKLRLGFGTYGSSGAYEEAIDAKQHAQILKTGYDHGLRIIDTAMAYGKTFGESERTLGVALQELFAEGICTREDLFLTTKCGISPEFTVVTTTEEIFTSCTTSLKNLQTSYVDIFWLHRVDPQASLESAAQALSALIDQGKIRAVGLSEVDEDTIRAFRKAMAARNKEQYFVAVQFEYSLTNRHLGAALLSVCRELALTVFAFSPLVKGFLTEKTQRYPHEIFQSAQGRQLCPQLSLAHKKENLALFEALKKLASEAGCSIAQLALAWLIKQDVIPLISTRTEKHLIENILAQRYIDQLPKILEPETLLERPKDFVMHGSRRNDFIAALAPQVGRYSPTPRP